jgi:hypothetical protein
MERTAIRPGPDEDTRARPLHLCVAITTTGRSAVLSGVLPYLAAQSRPPERIILSACDPSDVAGVESDSLPAPVEVAFGSRGLCAQRNRALERAADADVIVFFDDDFIPRGDYLAAAESLFRSHPDVVVATGRVVADGVRGPGLTPRDAVAALASDPGHDERGHEETYGAYGCNMLLRMAPVRDRGVRFDERLPAYAWLEDIDFSRRLAPYGRVVRALEMRGVHLGTKTGRSAGTRLGYSQIANPVYLVRKGSLSWRFASRYILRNFASNAAKVVRPEAWVDRRGRLRGNLLAVRDLATGRLAPERIGSL